MINNLFYRQLRKKTYDILQNEAFQSPISRLIDYFLIILILLNVSAVIAESVDHWYFPNQQFFHAFERFSIVIFTVELFLRLWCVVEERPELDVSNWRKRWYWLKTPGAIIDIVSIMPAYINMIVTLDLRFLRVLRLFRLLKLTRYFTAMRILLTVIHKERESFKAVVFILLIMIVAASSGIYVVENQAQPEVFESIPKSMWWAVVTLTTVGYGDVIPVTNLGKFLGAVITILGVGFAALPAGILASALATELEQRRERLELKFREMLLSENIDLINSRHEIDKLRIEVGLNKEQAQEVVLATLREQRYEEAVKSLDKRNFCPHCGEKL